MYSGNPDKRSIKLSSSDSDNEPASKKPVYNEDEETKDKIDRLIKTIKNVQLKFVVSGKVDAPLVVISIKETQQTLHFPMYEEQKPSMFNVFKVSPFGKGTETVIDTRIRNSLELNHNDFEIMNPNWNKFINNILIPRITEEMTLQQTFNVSLHKLLLYQTGTYFKPHRDSEKEPGMFGTLVVQLPSKYEGGQLVVKHDRRSEVIDFSSKKSFDNEFSTFFTAFYCDCEHEVLQVTNGIRICLVYNMLSTGNIATNIPTLPSRENVSKMIELKNLLNEMDGKIVYCFAHQYTECSLCFSNLKSTDYEIARLFKNLANDCSLEIMFGLLKKESQGYNDFDSEEEGFREYSVECLQSIDNVTYIPKMSVDFESEVIPSDCFEDVDPDHTKEDRNTGNCGVEVTRFYNLAAMVVFKKRK